MLIGIPKEIKDHEYRVGAIPSYVRILIDQGHKVIVETGAATKIGFTDEMYKAAGAKIVDSAKDVYEAEMIIKVKEPQESEYSLLKENQILFCYLHLAPDMPQAKALISSKCVAIAYETVVDSMGQLPLLIPMSEIAGRVAIQAGATALQMANGGKGVLLGGIPGVRPGRVVVIGGGIVGTEALRMSLGLHADVTVIDINVNRLRQLEDLYAPALKTLYSSPVALESAIKQADLVIGAVLIPGKKAPKLVTRAMVQMMEPGSVIVDVAIDQGGCIETSRPTTHSSPTYVEEKVIHYCVTNMPGACARTGSEGLNNATLPYALKLANLGYRKALMQDPGFIPGLNACQGHITHPDVAHDLGLAYVPPSEILLNK